MATYIGFSTVDKMKPSYTLVDVELVKRDLMNHFSTRIGERPMLPEFGCRIYDVLMDPQDVMTQETILEEARRIIESDPRVELNDINLIEMEHSIVLQIQLIYTGKDKVEEMLVEFSKEEQ